MRFLWSFCLEFHAWLLSITLFLNYIFICNNISCLFCLEACHECFLPQSYCVSLIISHTYSIKNWELCFYHLSSKPKVISYILYAHNIVLLLYQDIIKTNRFIKRYFVFSLRNFWRGKNQTLRRPLGYQEMKTMIESNN